METAAATEESRPDHLLHINRRQQRPHLRHQIRQRMRVTRTGARIRLRFRERGDQDAFPHSAKYHNANEIPSRSRESYRDGVYISANIDARANKQASTHERTTPINVARSSVLFVVSRTRSGCLLGDTAAPTNHDGDGLCARGRPVGRCGTQPTVDN